MSVRATKRTKSSARPDVGFGPKPDFRLRQCEARNLLRAIHPRIGIRPI